LAPNVRDHIHIFVDLLSAIRNFKKLSSSKCQEKAIKETKAKVVGTQKNQTTKNVITMEILYGQEKIPTTENKKDQKPNSSLVITLIIQGYFQGDMRKVNLTHVGIRYFVTRRKFLIISSDASTMELL
jgi:hypothetical protein